MAESSGGTSIPVELDEGPSKPDVDEASRQSLSKAQERARSLIGKVLSGRYRIVDLIAMGGMGAVYLGEHVHMHKRIAIKMLHPESEDHPEIVARFEREALVGAHVKHPNIANATDFGKLDDGAYFLVLEYVEGTNLAELIKQGPIPPPRVARIVKQVASALAVTHDLGIIHRDLKPRNVMIEAGAVPKLIDFGFAKVKVGKLPLTVSTESRPASRLTGVGVIFGTINYLAPEAAHGMDAVDNRADLYALGIMMYEMLTGKHPFDATDPVEMFTHHRTTKPPTFKERAPSLAIPAGLEAVVEKLLEKDPYDRYQSAVEVMDAIDALGIEEEPPPQPNAYARSKTPPPVTVEEISRSAPSPPSASSDTLHKPKKAKRKKPKAAEPSESATKPGSINIALAVIATVAILAAAFFATR